MLRSKLISLVLILILNTIQLSLCELKLVHVVFRHGDKTPDKETTYPTDPHSNYSYEPFGPGQLANEGRRRAYMIGKALRTRYNTFLGPTYSPDILEAVATEVERTRMSLLLLFAGLYPPQNTELEWNEELNWQPITYSYALYANDKLLSPPYMYCHNYIQQLKDYSNSPMVYEINRKHAELYEYLSNHTGLTVDSLFQVFYINMHLKAQSDRGLKIPSWTMPIYPTLMENAAIDYLTVGWGTTKLIQLSGGVLLKQIMENMERKISGDLKPHDRKLFLFAGHDYNVGSLLSALEVFSPHIPPYGSYIIIELHHINHIYGVKILYQDYSSLKPKHLVVPGCSELCPMHHFVKILQKNLPIEADACGNTEAHKNVDFTLD